MAASNQIFLVMDAGSSMTAFTSKYELTRPPHGLWELERGGVACCGYAVDFARSGLSQRQNSD